MIIKFKIYESNKWSEGYQNTKTFNVTEECGYNWNTYLQGCRHCDSVVPLKNMFNERQMVGNVYQSLCNCTLCDRYVIFDEDKTNTLEYYLNLKMNTEIDKYNL